MTEPVDPAGATPLADAPLELTLADHRQQFGRTEATPVAAPPPPAAPIAQGPGAPPAATDTPVPAAEAAPAEESPGDTRTRDDQGRFQKREGRAPAAKDVAHPADVPRIRELSKRVRELQAENAALKQGATPKETTPVAGTTPEPPRERPTPVVAKPSPDQFESYEAYLDARDTYNRAQWSAEQRAEQEAARITTSWSTKVEAARKRYDDFDAVALEVETPIPRGSLMDAWILESTQGAELLYALHRDPAECQRIASLPPVQQAEALALLGQRLMASQAEPTGATRTPPLSVVPRPPTPVRTGPLRTSDEVPGDDASLREHRRVWGAHAPRR